MNYTEREKAEQLIRQYYTFGINKEGQTLSWLESKKCALIAVDELIEEIVFRDFGDRFPYWMQVKQEIKNL